MLIEERLRIGLRREESVVDVSTDDALAAVHHRLGRRRIGRWTAGIASAAAVAAAGLVGLPLIIGTEGNDVTPPAASGPATADPRALHGTYEVDVADVAGTRALGVQGTWRVTVRADGVLDLAPPEGYGHPTSGAGYVASADRLTTNALVSHPGCQSGAAGSYAWSRTGDLVRFEVIDDACLARAALFADQPWERVP